MAQPSLISHQLMSPHPLTVYGPNAGSKPSTFLVGLRDSLIAVIVSMSVVAGAGLFQGSQPGVINSSPVLAAPVETPAPPDDSAPVVAESTKPSSNKLQQLLNTWHKKYPGAQFGVEVKELVGTHRSASINAHQTFDGASIYKLFVEDYLYTNIEKGRISFSQHIGGSDRNVRTCLDAMIVYSDNPCGMAMGYGIGWTNIHNFVRSQGFSETTETPNNTTTAYDLTDYLNRLQAGKLIDKKYAKVMIANMRKQVFRSGVPAGSNGVTVADKVGFARGYWNDAALVYDKHGQYTLVVLSKNAGSAPIKDLAQRVHRFMSE